MKRGRGFIYTTPASTKNQPLNSGGGLRSGNHPPVSGRGNPSYPSPRKRQRSPETYPTTSSRATRGGYEARQGRGEAAVSSVAKLAKTDTDDYLSFGEDDDDLDILGTAALEQFELTQRSPSRTEQSHIPPVSHSDTRNTVSATSLGAQSYNPNLAVSQKWGNDHQNRAGSSSSKTTESFHHGGIHSSQVAAQYDEYKEKIEQLQEQNYTKDGEVKVLRKDKEKLMSELRKKDEQIHDLQTKYLLEKQSKEEQRTKEKEALMSRLHFKDQELISLREKYSFLEQAQKNLSSNTQTSPTPLPKQMQPSSSSSTKGRSYHQTLSANKSSRTEFLSTETFMPISQVADVTPVRIGHKRPAQDEHQTLTKEIKKENRRSKSPSVSPSTSTRPLKKADPKKSVRIRSSNSETQPTSTPSQSSHQTDLSPVLVDMPKRELGEAQLLRLLIKHDLVKAPSSFTLQQQSSLPAADTSSNENSDTSQSTVESIPSLTESRKITGLLSLLRLEERLPTSPSLFSNVLKTPVRTSSHHSSEVTLSHNLPSLETYKPIPALNPGLVNSPAPTTPIRKPRLGLKSHTCARTDVARGRPRPGVSAITPMRSLSEASSPISHGFAAENISSSLVSSVDKRGLERSIAGLLRLADNSKLSSISRGSFSSDYDRMLSFSVTSAQSLQDPVLQLLNQISDLIIRYFNEQSSKVKALANMSGHFTSDLGGDSADVSSVVSPKSNLSSSSTISSKGSSDLISPLEGDQKFISQALNILETLVLYSRNVREHIMIRPPEFIMESRPSSSLGVHQVTPNVTANTTINDGGASPAGAPMRKRRSRLSTKRFDSPTTSSLAQVAHRLTSLQEEESPNVNTVQIVTTPKKVKEWKKAKLVNHKLQQKVWTPQDQTLLEDSPPLSGVEGPHQFSPITHTLTGVHVCAQLFSVLLDLPVPPWRESIENTTGCLRILTALAEHCPVESLSWFSSLLQQEEKLGVCLDKDDPNLTLVVLKLLTSLTRSPDIARELCGHGDPCIPITCYQCLVEPPKGGSLDISFKIRLQVLRFISSVLVLSNGPKVLFETCSCSYELLKSVVIFLNGMLEDVNHMNQWTHQKSLLVRESLLVLHKINIHDRFFDTHRETCEYGLTFVLNTLSWLLKTSDTPLEDEVLIVSELLEYCEELDDSQEDSEESATTSDKSDKMETS